MLANGNLKNSDAVIDALVKNCIKLSSYKNASETLLKSCEAIANVVPAANVEVIQHKITELSGCGDQKVDNTSSESDVKSFVYSLLQKKHKNAPKSSTDTPALTFTPAVGFHTDISETNPANHPFNDDASSPNMVIHVCDEAKNLKQDFDCPRDLLVKEMRYFAEYLSVDSQRLEEVDISVHCDIHIFDWLMKYVKRGTTLVEDSDVPRLDPNNVISILISSDFLKMESLVEACISYCHKHLSVIVSTPCNMNCVNEKLTALISEKFTHHELEEVKDRKDKFKSKLFCKKIEKLFDPNIPNYDSPGKANTLFKCSVCNRVLTIELNSKLPCTNNRLSVSTVGGLTYKHEPDLSWDINNYLIGLFEELHKWNLVYWRLWGIINHLTCSRCGQTFQLCDLGNCRYHPDRPQYHQMNIGDTSDNPVGLYPCCNQRVLRFDPTGLNKGCRCKDHIVTTSDSEERRKLDDLLAHKNLIKSSLPVSTVSSDLNIFASEEQQCSIKEATMTPVEIYSHVSPAPIASLLTSPPKVSLRNRNEPYNEEEDLSGEEDAPEYKKTSPHAVLNSSAHSQSSLQPAMTSSSTTVNIEPSKVSTAVKKKEKIQVPTDNTSYKLYPSKQKWDSTKSVRWNQDMQREEDRRRLTSMATTLAKNRSNERVDKLKTKDPKELPGGIFMKLEAAFLSNLKAQGNYQMQSLSRTYGMNKDFKSKARR